MRLSLCQCTGTFVIDSDCHGTGSSELISINRDRILLVVARGCVSEIEFDHTLPVVLAVLETRPLLEVGSTQTKKIYIYIYKEVSSSIEPN